MTELRTHTPDPAAPRPAEGTELIGEYRGSGYEEAPYLVRRADGQFVHLSRLLYLVVEATDGRRDFERIAERVSQEYARGVSAENVRFLVENKLRPLGVLAPAEGESIDPPRLKQSLLGLKYRVGLVPPGIVRFLTIPFLP